MAPKPYDLAAADEEQRSYAIEPVGLPDNSTAHTKHFTTYCHAAFDARDSKQFRSNNNVSDESARRKAAKIPPRTRILAAAAELFLKHGIAGVSVEAIAKAAATGKPTLYNYFASKDELVAQYLRESAKRLDACWSKIGPSDSASAPVQLGAWLAEMADGLVNGWACRLADAAAQLKEESHPAQRVIKTYNALQRRRLTRLCRAAGLRNPSMLADALILVFDGACIMAPSVDRTRLSSHFLRLSEAMIAAHAKGPSARRLSLIRRSKWASFGSRSNFHTRSTSWPPSFCFSAFRPSWSCRRTSSPRSTSRWCR